MNMNKIFDWKNLLFINTIFFPDTFISVVEVIFFSSYLKLSFSDFSFIFSFCLFISIFLQVPTGYISDRFGRKLMLIIGSFLDILGIIFIIFLPHIMTKNLFVPVLIIELLRTSMKALANGNFDVLVFEMFKKSNIDEIEFMKKSSKFFSIGAVLAAFSGLLSTILFSYAAVLPLMLDMIIKILQFIANCFIDEHTNTEHEKTKTRHIFPTFIFDKKLMILLIVLALLFTISRGNFSLYQPLMSSLNIPLVYYGIIIMIINFSVFFLLKIVKKYMRKNTIYSLLPIVIIVLFSQPLIILNTFTNNIIIRFLITSLIFSSIQITRLISEGLSSYFINMEIKDKNNKTTIFSSYSMIANITLSGLFFILGFLQKLSLSYINIYCLIAILIGSTLMIIKFKLKEV